MTVRRTLGSRRAALRVGVAAAAMCVPLVLSGIAWASAPSPGSAAQVKSIVAASHSIKVLPSNLTPALASASNDNPEVVYPATKYGCATATQCVFGDTSATKTIVLFGDSHSEMWLSSMIPFAVSHNLKIVLLLTLDCPVASVTVWLSPQEGYYTACNSYRSKDISLINSLKPADVVVSERTAHVKRSPSAYFTNKLWQTGVQKTLTLLRPSGARILVIGDITLMNAAPPACLAANPTNVQKCSTSNPNKKANTQGHQAAEKAAALKEGARFLNPIPWLCAKTCSPVIGNMVVYWDSYHMSNTYATYLSRVMGAALQVNLK